MNKSERKKECYCVTLKVMKFWKVINSIDSAQLGIQMTKKAKPPRTNRLLSWKEGNIKTRPKQDYRDKLGNWKGREGEDDKPNYNVQTPEERLRNSEHNEARILQEDLRKVWTQWLTQ